ncbi:MAG: hypothetical protein RSF67_07770 [Clostridia bacterium]
MTKYLIQHGPAKGSKIENAIKSGYCDGVVFSPREETIESIINYCKNDFLNKNNTFYDPQFYYVRYDSSNYKNLDKNLTYPFEITRRDWRTEDDKLINYFANHASYSSILSNHLITPGLCIDCLDWKFDNTLEFYNFCKEEYKQFKSYYLTLAICENMFHSKNDLEDLLEDINSKIDKKDGIYFIVVHANVENNNNINNYEFMDEETISNILYFIYKLRELGFKILSAYNFINSILFTMIGVDFVSGGWFNTLRKFSQDRFESINSFGIRKKRYTSIPLLSYFTGDLASLISKKMDISFMLSDTPYDSAFMNDFDSLSFVDYEQEFWVALNNLINKINGQETIKEKITFVRNLILTAIQHYDNIMSTFSDEQEICCKLKNSSAHLNKWLLAIDLFENKALII